MYEVSYIFVKVSYPDDCRGGGRTRRNKFMRLVRIRFSLPSKSERQDLNLQPHGP